MDLETNTQPSLVRQYNSPSNIDSAIKILKLYLKDLKKIKYNLEQKKTVSKIIKNIRNEWLEANSDIWETEFEKFSKDLKMIYLLIE